MLLTRERVRALAQINRFAGWTSRPYSVLEHSVIGARLTANPVLQKAMLLHDMEETVWGDIISPVKHKYMPAQYHLDVEMWVRELAKETGVPYGAIAGEQVHHFDAVMLAAETRTVYVERDEDAGWRAETPSGGDKLCEWAQGVILDGRFQGQHAVDAFWQMFAGK